jgi:hypothetical protein
MRIVRRLAIALAFVAGTAWGQQKVEAPRSVTVKPGTRTLSVTELDACLTTAQQISELTDRANIAKSRGDIATFNSTVAPYNAAQDRWNAGCLTPYLPGDLIRAENARGVRLCKFTRTPCLSEQERVAVLASERARQGRQPSQAKSGAVLRHSTAIAPSAKRAANSPPLVDSGLAWWLTHEVPLRDSRYRNMPSLQLHEPLQRISVLSCRPSDALFSPQQCAEIASNGGSFMAVEDIDADGKKELIETAAGITPDGRRVAALIVSDPADPNDHTVFLQEGPGFSALFRGEDGLSWYSCMECGDGYRLIAGEGSARFELAGAGHNAPGYAARSRPVANDIPAETAWAISEASTEIAVSAVRRLYGDTQSGADQDRAIQYQKIVYENQVRERVRAALPAASADVLANVVTRIVNSDDAGMNESIEAVCVPDMMRGDTGPAAVARCKAAHRDGFIHAYERRQQIESRQ